MDEGAPEVGDELSMLEEPLLIPPPAASSTPALGYKVGPMQRSSGYLEVHPSSPVIQLLPQQFPGEPFQLFLHLS